MPCRLPLPLRGLAALVGLLVVAGSTDLAGAVRLARIAVERL